MDYRTRGVGEMIAAMVISGTIGFFVIRSGRAVVDVVFWRCVFAAIPLAIFCGTKGLLRPHMLSRKEGALAAIGGVAIVGNWLLLFAAYSRASISIATVVYSTQPFMLVCLGSLFLSERITARRLAWLIVAFLGGILLVQASGS